MSRRALLCSVALLLPLQPARATAQESSEASTGRLVTSGLVLGAAGYTAGAIAGRNLERALRSSGPRGELGCMTGCGDTGELILAVLGGSTGVAAGVHWANGSAGDFGRAELTSVAIGAGGAAAVVLLSKALLKEQKDTRTLVTAGLAVAYLVVIPAAQLATAIDIERR